MIHYWMKTMYSDKFELFTEEEYLAVAGAENTRPYGGQVYRGEITILDVPEDVREAVQEVVNARIARWGTYENREISDSQALNIITGGNE